MVEQIVLPTTETFDQWCSGTVARRIDLVVSAYAAQLKWLEGCPRDRVRLLIYDKGERLLCDRLPSAVAEHATVERRPNVGKNDETYLHHIVSHYDDLADWTVFTVDHPFDHMNGADFGLMLSPRLDVLVPWLCRVKDWGVDGRLEWHRWENRPDANGTNWAERYRSGKITHAKLSFVEFAAKWGIDLSRWQGYGAGGVFGVNKAAILRRSRGWYDGIRQDVSCSVEPEEGHYLERLFVQMFRQP